MSSFMIALLFSAGASTWIYAKFMRSTGNNTKTSVVSAAISGVVIFALMMIILSFIM